MNKTIKKIVALGMGITMLAGTAAMAFATDLSSYPAPFVSNGVFVGKIVIGEKAATSDVVGAIDIAASLQRAATTPVSVTSGGVTTSVAGGYRLDTPSQMIYYGSPIGVQAVTSTGLSLLSDNTFYDQQGTSYGYTQTIKFSQNQTLAFSQHLGSSVNSFLGFDLSTYVDPSSSYLYADKVDFSKVVNATSTNAIGQSITLFGKQYTFSSESSGNTLVLYGSSQTVSVTPSDTVTQTIGGQQYTIKVLGFSSSADANGHYSVSVSVNGDTKTITEGNSAVFTNENNLKIFAQTVSSWNQGNSGVATLQLGADKLTLQDGHTVQTGTADTSIQGTLVKINEGGTADVGALSSLHIYVNGQQSNGPSSYIQSGTNYVDPIFGTFQMQYAGENFPLGGSSSDTVKVQASGSTQAFATITPFIGATAPVNVYFDYSNGASHSLSWSSNSAIHSVEGDNVPVNDYLYLSPNTDTDASHTHLVQVTGITMDATSGYVQFQDVASGTQYTSQKVPFLANGANSTLNLDGYTYNVELTGNNSAIAGGKGVTVAVTESSQGIQVYPAIELKGTEWVSFVGPANITAAGITSGSGTKIQLPTGVSQALVNTSATTYGDLDSNLLYNLTWSGATLTAITPAIGGVATTVPAVLIVEPKDYNQKQSVWYIPTTGTGASSTYNVGSPVYVSADTSSVNSGFMPMADTYTTSDVDYYGTYVNDYNPSGNNGVQITAYVPTQQMYANVFVAPTGAATSSASTAASSSGAVALNPISVGMAILDSNAQLGSAPYIVVGGPCVNTVSAALMGNPADCTTGFSEGTAMIKLFSNQNALLVAGYSAQDTTGATRVLANYADYNFSGSELQVITTNLNSLSVQAVTPGSTTTTTTPTTTSNTTNTSS